MAKQKFYVVWNGANAGIYTSWEACEAAVKGVSGVKYQSFKTEAEAQEYAAGLNLESKTWRAKDGDPE